MQPWFCCAKYSEIRSATEKLVEIIKKYQMYLKDCSVRNSEQQHSTELTRSPVDNVIMSTIAGNNEPVSNEYVDKIIDESPDYHPVFLNDFAPEDHFDRRRWISKLQLPVKFFIYL